jgi:hypothetical protein
MATAWGLLVGLVHGQTLDSVKVRKKHAIGVGVNAQLLHNYGFNLNPIPPYYAYFEVLSLNFYELEVNVFYARQLSKKWDGVAGLRFTWSKDLTTFCEVIPLKQYYYSDGVCGLIHYFGAFVYGGSKFFPFPKRRIGLSSNIYFGVVPYTARLYFLKEKETDKYLTVLHPDKNNVIYSQNTTLKNYGIGAIDVMLGIPILLYSGLRFALWLTPNVEFCFRSLGYSLPRYARILGIDHLHTLSFGADISIHFVKKLSK